MDDDLLKPISINLDDYEDEVEVKAENEEGADADKSSTPLSAARSASSAKEQAAQGPNPVPDPEELERLLSGKQPSAPKTVASGGVAAPEAPRAPIASGVPPLPDSDITRPIDAPPPQVHDRSAVAEAVTDDATDDDDIIVETEGDDDDHIRPIDVMSPSSASSQFGAPPVAAETPNSAQDVDSAAIEAPPVSEAPRAVNVQAESENPAAEGDVNHVSLGEEINLTRMDPGLKRVMIGMGWDAKIFSDDSTPDLDVSLFLLNKDNKTREDADFVFYNNMEACDGGVKHHGDNRTGAGDGDDENITVKLSDIPFDVVAMDIVLTIYQGLEKEQSFKDVENIFFRLVNADTKIELLRLELDKVVGAEKAIGVKIGKFTRVGPNWFFEASAVPIPKGLSECATEYGIVVAEML
tara:strand:- start:199193 stop:200422 length:1230 start_codon:yes stop_codon:yes gene_type:complete